MKHPIVFKLGTLVMSLGIFATLLSACSSGVPQKEVDTLKQQLTTKEQAVIAANQEGTRAKQELDTVKKNNVWSIIPNAPPRLPAPPPVPGAPPPPPPPTPPPAKVVPVFLYVDTVTSGPGESKYNVDPSLSCMISGAFKRGQQIVWRMQAVDTTTGKILQATDVKSAVLKLPKGETTTFRFGRHGATDDSPWFWTTAWSIAPDYPLGVIDFTVELTTNDGKIGTFKQLPVSNLTRNIESRLMIVE